MPSTITILSPVAEVITSTGEVDAAKSQLGTEVRLGILSNGKPNTDLLINGMLEVLGQDARLRTSIRERKTSSSQPADEAIIARLVSSADLVVGATAD